MCFSLQAMNYSYAELPGIQVNRWPYSGATTDMTSNLFIRHIVQSMGLSLDEKRYTNVNGCFVEILHSFIRLTPDFKDVESDLEYTTIQFPGAKSLKDAAGIPFGFECIPDNVIFCIFLRPCTPFQCRPLVGHISNL